VRGLEGQAPLTLPLLAQGFEDGGKAAGRLDEVVGLGCVLHEGPPAGRGTTPTLTEYTPFGSIVPQPKPRALAERAAVTAGAKRAAGAISTTGHAILGLLAVAPGTAYDLAKRMQTNYRFYWPRAESKLYEEVKALVALGVASVREGRTGRRRRSVYRITAAGRRALSAWMEAPGEGPALSFEGLLKVQYADFGTAGQLARQLRAIEEEASRIIAMGRALGEAYAAGQVQLVRRTPTNALVWRFLWEHFHALRDWARWARRESAAWRDTRPTGAKTLSARRSIARALRARREPA
jgi:DNA-binding PadR family transcriptional regulator